MKLLKNVSLKAYNTFGIDVGARLFISINTQEELITLLKLYKDEPILIIGGGSNLLLTKDIDALVIHINNKGISIRKETKDAVHLNVKAGENWHEFVLFCIKNNYGGVENLSLIPGNVGTAPIQNIGAYGVEIATVFESCEAIEIATGTVSYTHLTLPTTPYV